MVDRLFPGAGVNSFLRQNGILKGFGDGEVKKIDEVASVTQEEKSQMINPNVTVPVTSNDIQVNTVNGVTPLEPPSEIQDVGMKDEGMKDEGMKDDINSSPNQTETYKCPCSKKPACPCSGNKQESFDNPATNIKEVWQKFSSNMKKDTFRSGRIPRNTIEVIDKAAETIKTTLTGSDKSEAEKNVVEGFCNEHWHGVATSVMIAIVIVFIALSIMIFLTFIKIIEKNCKRKCVKCYTAMTGGNDFAQEHSVHGEELEGEIF